MKRWMALLLCCLLCLCAVGATAEGAVTIEFRSDNSWVYDIYPNGYVKSKGGSEAQFFAHEGSYIFKGKKWLRTLLWIFMRMRMMRPRARKKQRMDSMSAMM